MRWGRPESEAACMVVNAMLRGLRPTEYKQGVQTLAEMGWVTNNSEGVSKIIEERQREVLKMLGTTTARLAGRRPRRKPVSAR